MHAALFLARPRSGDGGIIAMVIVVLTQAKRPGVG
jgi:hypothetical protein